jgi:hypothetical protein
MTFLMPNNFFLNPDEKMVWVKKWHCVFGNKIKILVHLEFIPLIFTGKQECKNIYCQNKLVH